MQTVLAVAIMEVRALMRSLAVPIGIAGVAFLLIAAVQEPSFARRLGLDYFWSAVYSGCHLVGLVVPLAWVVSERWHEASWIRRTAAHPALGSLGLALGILATSALLAGAGAAAAYTLDSIFGRSRLPAWSGVAGMLAPGIVLAAVSPALAASGLGVLNRFGAAAVLSFLLSRPSWTTVVAWPATTPGTALLGTVAATAGGLLLSCAMFQRPALRSAP